MRVLHTIAGFGSHSGGTTSCTFDLLEALNATGITADLLTPAIAPGVDDKLAGNKEIWIKDMPYDCVTPYAFSRNMRRFLRTSEYDIYHTNGLWLDINHITCSVARHRKRPYVITPHGMLYPAALQRSSSRKKLMRKLFFDRDLKQASAIHATCEQEADHIRALGINTPIAIIANPIRIPANLESATLQGASLRPEYPAVGYLGRLHPRKNVDRIIEAFAQASDSNHRLLIMGAGTPEYERELRIMARDMCGDRVIFEGFVHGDEKLRKLASLRALVVASDFENFGMIVGESLLCSTPVICTRTAPWQDLKVFDCGRWVDNDVETLRDNIYTFLRLPLERIEQMGEHGRDLISHDYNPAAIASAMNRLYDWMLGNGDKPEFVI